MPETEQQNAGSADEATQGGEVARDFSWAEASVWTERMLSALVNGVKGGKWYALVDKVFALATLKAAWTRAIAFQNWARSLERKASFHPAFLNFPRKEPFDPSFCIAFSAMWRKMARFSGPLPRRVQS